ncbi:MAG: aminotransferase class V-fold PLP-dependent enzyme [Pseudomonadales bacterium]|nr:aminotransferase class V-fold PLP-dependent enzyme [Candidatus Woesebacteria bacterium]MCB9801525.1 aminotransferase class V-fold PLP-dependent enzyme [Pseudomonadales bacterium]
MLPPAVRFDFPILSQEIHGRPVAYLDNAATTQKPQVVLDAITQYYTTSNANVHRGIHALADRATTAWEDSRSVIAAFFAARPDELVITRNTTEAVNGVRYGFLDHTLEKGDVVVCSVLDHHATLVTLQQAVQAAGAELVHLDVDADTFQVDLAQLEGVLQTYTERVKCISLTHTSNVLGSMLDLTRLDHIISAIYAPADRPKVLLDAAQSAPHMRLDFSHLPVDFLAFSGHKMYGPMGSGGLLVKQELSDSDQMRPWLFGGGMIASVSPEKTEFSPDAAERFTAGTPDVASAVGLASACQYLGHLGLDQVADHLSELVSYTVDRLTQIPRVQVISDPHSASLVSFLYDGVHAHDVAQILDSQGVAVRSGHHCCMPLHTQFGWQASVRVSFAVYNTKEDVDQFVAGLEKITQVFGA